jgi:hypothetical protein
MSHCWKDAIMWNSYEAAKNEQSHTPTLWKNYKRYGKILWNW